MVDVKRAATCFLFAGVVHCTLVGSTNSWHIWRECSLCCVSPALPEPELRCCEESRDCRDEKEGRGGEAFVARLAKHGPDIMDKAPEPVKEALRRGDVSNYLAAAATSAGA